MFAYNFKFYFQKNASKMSEMKKIYDNLRTIFMLCVWTSELMRDSERDSDVKTLFFQIWTYKYQSIGNFELNKTYKEPMSGNEVEKDFGQETGILQKKLYLYHPISEDTQAISSLYWPYQSIITWTFNVRDFSLFRGVGDFWFLIGNISSCCTLTTRVNPPIRLFFQSVN